MNLIHDHRPFGSDKFGKFAERLASFLATPKYLFAQTLAIVCWIAFNGASGHGGALDPFPFILLNLVFSTQAAYAAPLILLAQTREAERDKAQATLDAAHRQALADGHTEMLTAIQGLISVNNKMTGQVVELTNAIHDLLQEKDRELPRPPE